MPRQYSMLGPELTVSMFKNVSPMKRPQRFSQRLFWNSIFVTEYCQLVQSGQNTNQFEIKLN